MKTLFLTTAWIHLPPLPCLVVFKKCLKLIYTVPNLETYRKSYVGRRMRFWGPGRQMGCSAPGRLAPAWRQAVDMSPPGRALQQSFPWPVGPRPQVGLVPAPQAEPGTLLLAHGASGSGGPYPTWHLFPPNEWETVFVLSFIVLFSNKEKKSIFQKEKSISVPRCPVERETWALVPCAGSGSPGHT